MNLKILVISTAKIGDIVCTTPVFREIKKKFPDSHLAALVTHQTHDLLKYNPHLDEIIIINDYSRFGLIKKLKEERYDWAFNLLLGSFNNIIAFWSLIPSRVATTHRKAGRITQLLSVFNNYRLEYKSHTWLMGHYLNLLKFIGVKDGSDEKELFWGEREEKKALDFLGRQNLSSEDLLVGISVTAGVGFKNWGDSRFALVSDRLTKELEAKIIFIGGSNDQPAIERVRDLMVGGSVNSAGCFALSELPALLKKLSLFISVDTGPLYIANAVQTPVINIGGCLDFREQSPTGKNSIILPQKNSDLYSFTDAMDSARKSWLANQLQGITPENVFNAARDFVLFRTK
ncbi:MAG: glycosyltransferase family 9 protein [Candidatus Nealsonbacteria bacterium]|nr:glycosyltransferase family 9 protein [Candidatus Nealsonbacteria bacterium]